MTPPLKDIPSHKIAVISVSKNKYSETFIHNQIKLLPAQVHHFYGAYLPLYFGDSNSFLPPLKKTLLLKAGSTVFRQKHIHNIASYCKKNELRALLAHYGPTGVAMSEVSAMTGIPLLVYFHGYDAYRSAELKRYRMKYQKMFHQAAAFFAASTDMCKQLAYLGAPSEKIIHNPCGADLQTFKFNDVSQNPPVFLAVGRLEPKKNPVSLIDAFAVVQKSIPQAKLKIVGKGPLYGALINKIKSLNLQKCIELKGVLNPEQIALEMHQALVFVQNSETAPDGNREGSPVSIMEAGACGLPVVSTRHEGIKDIIIENHTGLLIESGDTHEMARAMTALALDRELVGKMGRNAHTRITNHFSLEKNVKILWETIERFVSV